MNMYKRIIIVVSFILFSLLALVAAIITDLNDRDFPQAIGSKSRIDIRFNQSEISINEAFLKLAELDTNLNLRLVKVTPDFDKGGDSEIFATLNDNALPNEFTWFRGDHTAKIVNKNRLANSFPDGVYLVTGNTSHLDEFVDSLKSIGGEVVRRDVSVLESLLFVVKERGFAAAVLASLALISSLSLFWLSMKARGRALRVLGGCPTTRIQMQDITGFGEALLVSAGIVAVVSTSYIGIFHGLIYINIYLKVLISLQVFVIILSVFITLIMSTSAWPSAMMLVNRQPPVRSLRSVAIVIQALTFVLVVSSVSPAWSTYKQSLAIADEMAQWKKLADQVSIVFATDINEMDRTETKIGELVKDAESAENVALSYTYTKEMWPSVDFGDYTAISFVNERWLDLVSGEMENSVEASVSQQSIPENLIREIREQLLILSRKGDIDNVLQKLQFRQTVEKFRFPVILGGGGGSLHFGDNILLVVIPSLYDTFNDSNLTSIISTSNIIFTGVTATEQLLERHQLDVQTLRKQGFQGELQVVYIAEEGILRAQFAVYLVWLQNLSLITLIIAFSIATAISALISATLQAKRDFPLRLSGKSWIRIIQSRVLKEFLAGIILIIIVILLQKPDEVKITLITAVYGLFIVLISHLSAVHWCFNGVSRRRI